MFRHWFFSFLFIISLGLLLAGHTSVQAQYRQLEEPPPMQGSPEILKKIGIDQKLNAQIPLTLPFKDETGRDISLQEYFGTKPVILAPVYYECPMLCTLTINGVVQSLDQLKTVAGKDFLVVAVSFNPLETPDLAMKKKENYLQMYNRPGSEAGWHFLTGPESSIKQLMDSVGFRYAWDESIKQYAHASGVILLTPQGKVSKYFYGVQYPANELQASLTEAGKSQIGKPADPVLLYCFQYDSATGKYTLITRKAMKVGGVITVLGLVSFIGLMLYRERKQVRP